jgi:hypothetical protein
VAAQHRQHLSRRPGKREEAALDLESRRGSERIRQEPRNFRNRARMALHARALKTSGRSNAAAAAGRVKSSSVGPRPPVRITAAAREDALRISSTIRPRSSGQVAWKAISNPNGSNSRAISWRCVSRDRPRRSSVPVVTRATWPAGVVISPACR